MKSATSLFRRDGRRAGVLITALIFAAIIALAIPGYLGLSNSALKLSHRNFYRTAVVDLAETGLDHGMWALNAASQGNTNAWTGWDLAASPGDARRQFSGFTFTGGVTGYVNVVVKGYAAPGASVVARAVIAINHAESVEKWAEVTTGGRSLFPYGLLARNTITAAGGALFDSWNSDPNNTGAVVPYGTAVARDQITIGTVSTSAGAVRLNPSAVVYGKVGVGREGDTSTISYGKQTGAGKNNNYGLYQDWGTKIGPKTMPTDSYPYLEPGHLLNSFSATFDTVTLPDSLNANIIGNTYVLPRSVSGPPWYLASETIGADNTKTVLQYNKVTVEGAATLTIRGDVTLVLPPTSETLKITASGKLQLADGASLTIYTPGNIDVSGAGIVNPSAPKSVQIWSTRAPGSTGQTINLAGSGNLSGVIYAPEATLNIPGGTHFYGAAVVSSASLTGSGKFHYDEALKSFGSGSSSVGIASYDELDTPAQRAPHSAVLTF